MGIAAAGRWGQHPRLFSALPDRRERGCLRYPFNQPLHGPLPDPVYVEDRHEITRAYRTASSSDWISGSLGTSLRCASSSCTNVNACIGVGLRLSLQTHRHTGAGRSSGTRS